MGGYIANFTVYTMAMIGLICFAVFIYKKFTDGTMRSNDTKFLSIEESMSLNPRKTLHVVRAGSEKFLIASDVDRTTLISKLENEKICENQNLERFRDIPLIVENEIVENKSIDNNHVVKFEKVDFSKRPKRELENSFSNHKSVTLDFETSKTHGFGTMKEMAKKINEL